MRWKTKFLFISSCVFLVACSGGEQADPTDSVPESSVRSDSSQTSVSLDFGDAPVSSARTKSWFQDISPGPSGKEKLVFTAPQDCLSTPLPGSTEEFVEALYRNCLYRPIVADGNQSWVKRINNGEVGREQARDGVHRSPESRCLLGEPDKQDECSNDIAAAKQYEIVCDAESFVASFAAEPKIEYPLRAAERIKFLCPEVQFEFVE